MVGKWSESAYKPVFVAHQGDDRNRHCLENLSCMDEQVPDSPRFVRAVRALAGLTGAICWVGNWVDVDAPTPVALLHAIHEPPPAKKFHQALPTQSHAV